MRTNGSREYVPVRTVTDMGAFDVDELARIRREYVALYGGAFANLGYDVEEGALMQ